MDEIKAKVQDLLNHVTALDLTDLSKSLIEHLIMQSYLRGELAGLRRALKEDDNNDKKSN